MVSRERCLASFEMLFSAVCGGGGGFLTASVGPISHRANVVNQLGL